MDLPIQHPLMAMLDDLAGQIGYSPEVEAAARKMGFRNAAEALAWQQAQARKTGGSVGKQNNSNVNVQRGTQGKTPQPQVSGSGGVFGWVDHVNQALKGK